VSRLPATIALGCIAFAQAPSSDAPSKSEDARIDGQVLSDADGLPLRRAHVTLRPLQAGLSAAGVDADDTGNFTIRKIAPGLYSLIAERDGYLTSATCRRGALRMPPEFYIAGGDKITDITFRLRPWAVLAGKVRMDDGEPGVGVRVELYREYRTRGRHGYGVVSAVATNDRGEYRVYGLQPGAYFVAAVYDKAPLVPGAQDQPPTDALGRELPLTGYTTTFFPNTEKLSEALPIRVDSGQDLSGIDLTLQRVLKVKVRGQVTSGISGARLGRATMTLARADASMQGAIPTPAKAIFDRDGFFEMANVVPGAYVIQVEASDNGKTLSGRRFLTVSSDGEANVELVVAAPQPWPGAIVIEGTGRWPDDKTPRVTLEARSDTGVAVQPSVQGLKFECQVMADETYDVLVDNLADDFYVAAVRVGGSDMRALGLPGSLASPLPFEIVLDSRGGKISGRVFGLVVEDVWSGASMMLVPDPPRGRLQDYRQASADQYGQFQIRGVAPGKYTLVAWLEDPPCDVYDPDALDACRAAGAAVTVDAASDQNLALNMKAAPRR
jgi:hypothetical protein